jgi:hypothetical protein
MAKSRKKVNKKTGEKTLACQKVWGRDDLTHRLIRTFAFFLGFTPRD